LPSRTETQFHKFGEAFSTKLDFTLVQIGDLIDQNLNAEEPIPSLLIDEMIVKVETAKLFDDLGYYLLRFRHSAFGYKLRPWTVYLLTMKGIEFDAYDTLTQYLTDSEKYGFYPDPMTLNYLMLTLLEKGLTEQAVQVAKCVVLKDLATTHGLAQLCSVVLASNTETVQTLLEDKEFFAILRILSQTPELHFLAEFGNAGLANVQSENRILKSDHYYINPHLDYESLARVRSDFSYEDILEKTSKKILETVTDLDEALAQDVQDGLGLCHTWAEESCKLHNAYKEVLEDREEWLETYRNLEKKHNAGIQYALAQTGLWNQEEVMKRLGTPRMPKTVPPYKEHKHKLVAISDLELEQNVYEAENGEEWSRIRTFFQNRVRERVQTHKKKTAKSYYMRKGYKSNPRWDTHITSQFNKPSSVPKLPID